MSSDTTETQQIETVFCLGGGELEDQPFEGFAYWYDGAPKYAAREVASEAMTGAGYLRTLIAVGCEYGLPAVPDGWRLVRSFASSGEAQCWCVSDGPRKGCPVCEGDGIVYIGAAAEMVIEPEISGADDLEQGPMVNPPSRGRRELDWLMGEHWSGARYHQIIEDMLDRIGDDGADTPGPAEFLALAMACLDQGGVDHRVQRKILGFVIGNLRGRL